MSSGKQRCTAGWSVALVLPGVFAAACVLTLPGGALGGDVGGDPGMLVDPNAVPLPAPAVAPAPKRPRMTPAPSPVPRPPVPAASQPAASQPAFTGPPPVVKVDEPTVDFGKLISPETINATLKLKNVGEGTLTIESVQPTCGCTVMSNWAKTVPPGGTWETTATVRLTGYSGRVSKPVIVHTNDPKMREIRYTITGEVQARFAFEPSRTFQFQRCPRDKATSTTIKIKNQLEKPVALKAASSDNKLFKADVREISPGREYELVVSTVPPVPDGFTQGKILIETDSKEEPRVEVSGFASVPPRLVLTPTMIPVPTPVAADTRRSLYLRNEGDTPVHIKEVKVSNPGILTEVNTMQDGKQYRINVTVPKGLTIPPMGVVITIITDDAAMPQFVAQVRSYAAPQVQVAPPTTRPAPAMPVPSAVRSVPSTQRASLGNQPR